MNSLLTSSIYQLDEVYKILDNHNFEVFHQKQKIMCKEEIANLFVNFKHRDFYPELEEHMMTADSIILLLINKVEKVYDEKAGEEVKLESPIVRWK